MYSLKPITQHSIVELPSTMYEIKSIYTHLDENNSQINSVRFHQEEENCMLEYLKIDTINNFFF